MKLIKHLLTLLLLSTGVSTSWAAITTPSTPPFVTTTVTNGNAKFELGTKWYTIKNHDNKYLATCSTHLDNNGFKPITTAPTGETGYWCFTGSQTSGYILYNRPEGTSKVFAFTTTSHAQMADYNATVNCKTFDLVNSYWDGYYAFRRLGSTNNYVNIDGGSTNEAHLVFWNSDMAIWGWNKDASNATGDAGSAWAITEVAMEVELVYMDGATLVDKKQYAIPVGTNISSYATADVNSLPGIFVIKDDLSTVNVVDGTYTYTINVIDYSIGEAAKGNSTHNNSAGQRYTSQISFNMLGTTQTISTGQTARGQAIYHDCTSQKVKTFAGFPVVFSSNFSGSWMHHFVYLDEDYNGFHVNEAEDIIDHVLQPGKDLKAYTYLEGWKPDGTTITEAAAASLKTLPSFNAPTTTGNYRVRYKVDWSNTSPKGSSTIHTNGGLICDVTMEVVDYYTVTYIDQAGQTVNGAKALVSTGLSGVNAAGANIIQPGSVVTGFIGNDFQIRDIVAINGNDATLADLAAIPAGDNVVITLTEPYIKPGKYYTIQNTNADAKYAYINTDVLNAETVAANSLQGKHIFQFEAATASGTNIKEGMFYVKNVQTGRYVKRPNLTNLYNALATTETLTPADCAYWITNSVVPNRPDIYALTDAIAITDPNAGINQNSYWHNNADVKIVRWATANTTPNNSQWYLKRIPVVTIHFQDSYGNELTDINFTADGSPSTLTAQNKVLATVRNFDILGYAVVGRQLKIGDAPYEDYTSDRAEFYNAVAALTEDAEAIITIRPRTDGEVDVTLELWKAKGKGYTNEACTTGEVDFTTNAASTAGLKAWKLYNNGTLTDINGKPIPVSLGFTITSDLDNGVGGQIVSSYPLGSYYPYKYGRISVNGENCICFTSTKNEANNFTFKVPEGYYILQYEFAIEPGTNNDRITLSNPGGANVNTDNPATNAMAYNLTDTPAAQSCTFSAITTPESTGAGLMAANFFQVRIVNAEYLENSKGHGRSVCWNALQGGVGYPKNTTGQYEALANAIAAFDANDNLDNYCKMLQAYSRYISCRVINRGDDCAVYTLSFIKNDGSKKLLENVDGTLTIVDYNETNRAKASARWISHKNDSDNMVFVNKADGKYLQAKTASDAGLSTYYDANTTSFLVDIIHQDINDYMQSATDEKLLGAVYLKSNARVTNADRACVFTMQNSNDTWSTGDAPRFDDYTAAIFIEEVENGNTFNFIKFRRASDNKYYATYYGFYPVKKPDDATMYYATRAEEGYLHLEEVQEDVIRPYFPIILISDNSKLHIKDTEGQPTHLHIGELTQAKDSHITELLTQNGRNIMKGTCLPEQPIPAGSTIYVLSGDKETGDVGFFKYQPTDGFLPQCKAYYEIEAGEPAAIRGFRFAFKGVETQIDLQPEEAKDAIIYDLSGRRMQRCGNGLFIVNGKKVVMQP